MARLITRITATGDIPDQNGIEYSKQYNFRCVFTDTETDKQYGCGLDGFKEDYDNLLHFVNTMIEKVETLELEFFTELPTFKEQKDG